MEVVLAQPRGFCAGVVRAVEIVELALERFGAPVYVFHEIIHNRHVVQDLERRGAVFVDDLNHVPSGAVTIFSAHGVSLAVVDLARSRRLQVIDATCPLVTKVHLQAQRYSRRGYTLVIIGHPGHEEVVGTMGSVQGAAYVVSGLADIERLEVADAERVAYVTQTTLSVDDTRELIAALRRRFPAVQGPDLDDICYATQNRQDAVKQLARQVDLLLVVGARNSSNSNRLREVGEQHGLPAYLIQDETELDPAWLHGARRVGVTAGASAPEVLIARVCRRLQALGAASIREMEGRGEAIVFRLPAPFTRRGEPRPDGASLSRDG